MENGHKVEREQKIKVFFTGEDVGSLTRTESLGNDESSLLEMLMKSEQHVGQALIQTARVRESLRFNDSKNQPIQ